MSQIAFSNAFGDIIARPDQRFVEFRWHDSTADMSSDQFDAMLVPFAEAIEQIDAPKALIDVTAFRMQMSGEDSGFREREILPRYHAAGLTHFAFVMPEGAPPTRAQPQKKPGEAFPTGFFSSRQAALAWFNATSETDQ